MDRPHWDFTLRQLSIFVCAARAGSFARAAEQLGISQPAVSKCIGQLEAKLERRLFQRRTGASPILTRQGSELLSMAERLLEASDAIMADHGDGGGGKQRVRLCIGPMLRDKYLRPMLPTFYRDHPDIDLEIVPIIPLAQVQTQLDKGRVDLVTYTIGRPLDTLPHARLVSHVPVVMVGPAGSRSRIESGQMRIEDQTFILPGSSKLTEHWIERQLAQLGIHPRNPVLYLDFPDVIREMVGQGQGLSVLMREQADAAVADGWLEIVGPVLPDMHRIIMRSSLAGPAAAIVEEALVGAMRRQEAGGGR